MMMEMSSTVNGDDLTPEAERVLIRDIALAAESNSKDGDVFYLITQRWWQHWTEYVNMDQSSVVNDGLSLEYGDSVAKRPSSIDNSDLISDMTPDDSLNIVDSLLEGRDYVILPQDVWNQLYSWYGGGPTLPRKAICSGLSQTELAVEVYPLRLQLLFMAKAECSAIRISKKETIGELHKRACEIFDLNSEQVRIWDYYGHRKHAVMSDMDKTLDDANIQMDQDILVEVLDNVNGGLSANKGGSRSCSSDLVQGQNPALPGGELDSTYGVVGVSTRGYTCGLTGLQNLGNTCFMNSAIQCLVHTPEFAKYFREDYHQEINWQNPLGMVGELAIAFGELLRKLWAPSRTPVSPRQFKTKLARFAPQFSGYNQHDSQELLAFLLDGLHEDLNRVKKKPYVNSKDADGRPDEEVADEYWANHIARNDSIIVDVCQGQYKSTLVCPVCKKVSVTFDPFMYLSLPLQSTSTRSITVTIFTSDGSAPPYSCIVHVPKQGRSRDLIHSLSSSCSLKNDEELKLAEVRNHLFHRFLDDPLISLSTIKDDDHLVAYKIPKSLKRKLTLKLIHRRQDWEANNAQTGSQWKPYGVPLLSAIPCDNAITRGDLQKEVHKMLSPLLRADSSQHADVADLHGRSSGDACAGDTDNNKALTSSKLPLQLVHEGDNCIDLSVGEEKVIKFLSTTTSIVVYIDWSPKLLDKYDTQYIENLPEVLKYGPPNKKARNEPLSLYTCLEAFLREEPLVPEDMWLCPQCKERRQASKKLDLWRLPEVLVIHLKRFSYSRSMKHKLETLVNFPIHDLDLTSYVANKSSTRRQLYELYALTNHYGSMGSGHYTAFIKLLDENKWYNFDDSQISSISEDDVKLAPAYVLFYRRVKSDGVICNGGQSAEGHCSSLK